MIDLYTDATANGLKISIALEEMGVEYQAHQVNLGGGQKTPEFTAMNANQKIPVIKDGDMTLSESGAILYYLAVTNNQLIPTDFASRSKVMEALMFQMSGLGPNFGQLIVWAAAWNNEFPVVSERYQKEVLRQFSVLETRLGNNEYMGGAEYSIADIAFWPWIHMCHTNPVGQALPLNDYKKLSAWYEKISQRPAVQRGILVPTPLAPEIQYEAFLSAVVGLGDLHK